MYTSKIPPCVEVLFPLPSRNGRYTDKYWYSGKQVLGKNKLGSMMNTISVDAKLSIIYTNHCVRATCVTQLANSGFTVSDIQAVTGHKRADSVQRYIKQIDSSKKRKLSNTLSESLIVSQQIEQSNHHVNVTSKEQSKERLFSDCLFSQCTININ